MNQIANHLLIPFVRVRVALRPFFSTHNAGVTSSTVRAGSRESVSNATSSCEVPRGASLFRAFGLIGRGSCTRTDRPDGSIDGDFHIGGPAFLDKGCRQRIDNPHRQLETQSIVGDRIDAERCDQKAHTVEQEARGRDQGYVRPRRGEMCVSELQRQTPCVPSSAAFAEVFRGFHSPQVERASGEC